MADVTGAAGATAKGAMTGAAAGGPVGAVIGGGLSLLGNLFGSSSAQKAAAQAKAEYGAKAQQGIDLLKTGRSENVSAFSPYVEAGQRATRGTESAIADRTQYAQPELSNSSPSKVADYLNPSAAYSTRVANDNIRAAALGSGAAGGGMMRALSENANKLAMTNYNNAYDQMLKTGDQTFNQGQQQYTNKTAYDQSQIDNLQRLASMGVGAASNMGSINQNYDNNLDQSYKDWGTSNAGGTMARGNIQATAAQNSGNIAGQMAQNFSGIPAVGNYLSKLWG